MQECDFKWSMPFPGCIELCACAQGQIWLASGEAAAHPCAYSPVMGIGACAAGGCADADTSTSALQFSCSITLVPNYMLKTIM